MTAPATSQTGGSLHVHMRQMLETHPRPQSPFGDRQALVECIEACFDCAQTCSSCADACLGEPMVQQLTHCIRLNLDCADICNATGRALARLTDPDAGVLRAQVQACLAACRACGAECQKHAHHHRHCAVCAEACRRCEDACNRVLSAIG